MNRLVVDAKAFLYSAVNADTGKNERLNKILTQMKRKDLAKIIQEDKVLFKNYVDQKQIDRIHKRSVILTLPTCRNFGHD